MEARGDTEPVELLVGLEIAQLTKWIVFPF
jgi:hypothetical protein